MTDPLDQLVALANALSDENRARILAALQSGERCVCQIIALLDLAPSTVSKHLTILRHAGLIQNRKQARWMHYRLADRSAPPAVRSALAWSIRAFAQSPRARQDAKKLKAILAIDPETLCEMQRCGEPCCLPRSTRRGQSRSNSRSGACSV